VEEVDEGMRVDGMEAMELIRDLLYVKDTSRSGRVRVTLRSCSRHAQVAFTSRSRRAQVALTSRSRRATSRVDNLADVSQSVRSITVLHPLFTITFPFNSF
jgi:hypothetical protein